MTIETTQAFSPTVRSEEPPSAPESTAPPPLPTFDRDAGYRYVFNPETGQHDQVPLTLLDILFPTEEDVGVVVMTQSLLHDLWTNWLKVMFQNYLGQSWLVISDVLVHWGRKGAPPKGPDVAAIPGADFPAERKSYRVGPDGPLPAFVLEVTSEDTRAADLQEKPLHYAAVGVKEYLIIDFLPDDGGSWRLLGYRLEDSPYYNELTPDSEGGLTFETIGLRFVAVERDRIEVYEAETSKQLLTPDALQTYAETEAARAEAEAARAEAEAARAEAEATARAEAEARVAQLEARLQEMEARSQEQSTETPPDK